MRSGNLRAPTRFLIASWTAAKRCKLGVGENANSRAPLGLRAFQLTHRVSKLLKERSKQKETREAQRSPILYDFLLRAPPELDGAQSNNNFVGFAGFAKV
ncbi:hypothetical protein D6817_01775 [Candidatus Pacearchaeota archaeon]|nr:MAG: hypothetical protein D6817_01775 [Candidatus Pacearchaeota archaeon]